jgi:subtilisin-like proprotein convertase family protein
MIFPALSKRSIDQQQVASNENVITITKNGDAQVNDASLPEDEDWEIISAANGQKMILALDEAVSRDNDGKETVIKLVPAATRKTLPSRLLQLGPVDRIFPVAYLAEQEHTIYSRRIVTKDLRLQVDYDEADRLATQLQLAIKDKPSYAPGWVIFSAVDPFAALDAMSVLREQKGKATADVLLASQKKLKAMPNDPLIADQWHLKNSTTSRTHVNIESAWNYGGSGGVKGAGIRIGIVDDGLQTAHPDLVANVDITNDKDWNGGDSDPNPGVGDDHGTSCAGNAAAKGNNSLGVSGTAPDGTLVGMRLISAAATDAQEAEAMAYLPNLIQILSNSWGPNDTGAIVEGPQPLTLAALETAATSGRGGKGTIIMWAGGNGGDVGDNSNYDGYANSIYTIAIGALDSSGSRSYYSEPGSNVVVCAPSDGVLGITTVDRTGSNGYNTNSSASGGDYANDFGGTSSATPTAAGVVALMLEKNPNLGWRDVQEILIRSAFKCKPTDAGWVNNSAGFHFNHDFGAGLIDANAAVTIADTWTNLLAQTSTISTEASLSVPIPENNATGITRTFNLSASSIRVEQVTVKVDITHTSRGNLEISLTSPNGMVSKLTEVHADTNKNYAQWTFSSVRNWGESSAGNWTLKIADRSAAENSSGGTLNFAELKVFGTSTALVNPAPVVQITQPNQNQVFSPGSSVAVNVSASDLTATGTTGVISQVQLFDQGLLVGTDTTAPYSFSFSPTLGAHLLEAKATDSQGAVGTSVSVNFSVVNQAPVITAAILSASGQVYSDVALTVSSVTAVDPEGGSLTYSYQWQSSINQTDFIDVASATQATSPVLPGRLLRCVVTASDGIASSNSLTTASVNMLTRPVSTVAAGAGYSYTSGLVLRGVNTSVSRAAMIHEFSQGTGKAEWVEILTLEAASFRNWSLADSTASRLTFANTSVWDNIPVGTLIVIYDGASKDTLLPADDSDPSDGRMILSSSNTTYFSGASPAWASLNNTGDAVVLRSSTSTVVSQVCYGDQSSYPPNIGNVSSRMSAYFSGDDEAASSLVANWVITSSTVARSNGPRVAASLPISFGGDWITLPTGFTGSGIGTYASDLGGDTGFSSAKFDTSGDSLVIEFSSQSVALTYQIQGNSGISSATTGTFLIEESANGTSYTNLRTITNASNVDTAYSDAPATSTRFIRYRYLTKTAGNIQLDKLAITAAVPNVLSVVVNPVTISEGAGASVATATVTVSAAPVSNLVVNLSSFDTTEATVPSTVTILAGQTSATFSVTAIDDLDVDGTQTVVITAASVGYSSGTFSLSVTDNDGALTGVTPGAANTPANQTLITSLRNGSNSSSALFRIGSAAQVPAGLSLNTTTGVLSGNLANSNPTGNYLIVIERYNSLNEVVSQSFTLNLTNSINNYANWILAYPLATPSSASADGDSDGVTNAVENLLGTRPDVFSAGLTKIAASTGILVFEHSQSNSPATDLQSAYEWSIDLQHWNENGASFGGTLVSFSAATLVDLAAPANDQIRVTATATGVVPSRLFARLRVTQTGQ